MHTLAVALVLVLRAYDLAGVPPGEMTTAERVAADTLSRARIDALWVSCQPAALAVAACNEPLRGSELIIRLVVSPVSPFEMALADANVDTQSGLGSLATVYVDRVRRMASDAGVSVGELMGRAIAHEIGHLLFGTATHARTGLMRAVWSVPELRRLDSWNWRFSGREAERLRARLNARLEPGVGHAAAIEPRPPSQPPCATPRAFACSAP